jgi:uncharacterized membrane protein YhaH (DUF805 family)
MLVFLTWRLFCLIFPDETPISSTPTGSDSRYIVAFWPGFGLFLYLSFVITAKRLHDMNLSMWLAVVALVVMFIPPLNLLFGLFLLFSPPKNYPNQNSNRYGIDPRYVPSREQRLVTSEKHVPGETDLHRQNP